LEISPDEFPPDHYRLLQLDRYESSAETIVLAADRAMARVRAQRPGEYVTQWQALLDELATAKACLSDAARKSEYDNRLQAGFTSTQTTGQTTGHTSSGNQPLNPSIETWAPEALFPPTHRAEPTPLPASAPDTLPAAPAAAANVPLAVPINVSQHQGSAGTSGTEGVALPMHDPMAPVPHVSDVETHHASAVAPAAPAAESLQPLLTPEMPQKRSAHAMRLAAVMVGCLLLVASAALFFQKSDGDAEQSAVDDVTDQDAADQDSDLQGGPSKTAASSSTSPGKTVGSDGPAVAPGKRPDTSPRPDKPTVPAVDAKPDPKPEMPPKTVPAPSVSIPETTKPAVKPPPMAPKPSPTPPPTVEPRPTARQAAAFDDALKKAIVALQRRDATAVNRQLSVAGKNAISSAQQDRLDRVRHLQRYAGEFFKAVRAGYDALQGDEEFVIGGERMVVVDCTPKEITLRRRGRNQSFPPDAMPDSLSLTLANRWFDQTNPTSKVFIGAFEALRGKVDLARELWKQARGDGVSEVDFLLPVLKELPPVGKGKRR
jgi:hypothetical protein